LRKGVCSSAPLKRWLGSFMGTGGGEEERGWSAWQGGRGENTRGENPNGMVGCQSARIPARESGFTPSDISEKKKGRPFFLTMEKRKISKIWMERTLYAQTMLCSSLKADGGENNCRKKNTKKGGGGGGGGGAPSRNAAGGRHHSPELGSGGGEGALRPPPHGVSASYSGSSCGEQY